MNAINLKDMKPDRASELESRFIDATTIKPVLSARFLIKNWLSLGALSCLFGASNTGKTFVAVDLGLHIAAGLQWRGNSVAKGAVIYIAGEGGLGIQNRFAAYLQDRPECRQAEIYLLPVTLDLHGDIDATALCAAMPVDDPLLIIVDTLARAMGDGDENLGKDMNRFIASCDLLREVTGAHVMVVHHTGKDPTRGARGSNALYAATDTEILITTNGEIQCTKQRDMSYPDSLHFTLRTVTLGIDDEGDDVTSAVADAIDAPAQIRKPLNGKNEVALQALNDALRDHGTTRTGNCYPTNRRVVDVSHWREACDTHGITGGASESAARQAFKRAKDKLMDLDQIREFGGHVWRVQDDD